MIEIGTEVTLSNNEPKKRKWIIIGKEKIKLLLEIYWGY